MPEVDRSLHDYLSHALTVAVRSGFGRDADILADIEERVADELGEPDEALVRELKAEAKRLLAAQRAAEATWKTATVNDAIDRAFAELDAAGIVALQNAGYTMSDGWEDVNELATERAKRGRPRGATFYHGQDLERGVAGEGLLLAFGSYIEGPTHEAESEAIAREICEVLARHGVKTTWNGKVDMRIHIEPFEWRKRRWTKAPEGKPEAGRGKKAKKVAKKAARKVAKPAAKKTAKRVTKKAKKSARRR
jgi:hypothetical protein